MSFLGRMAAAIRAEVAAIFRVLVLLRWPFWLAWLALLPLSVVGLIGGAVGVYAQGAALVVLAGVGLFSGWFARWVRRCRWVRYPDGAEVVPFLPQLLTLLAGPFYFVAMAVLFARVGEAFPGTLPVSSWGDALVLVLDTFLHGGLSFHILDTFNWRLIPAPDDFEGRSILFVSRFLMDLVFVKLLIQLLNAAWYRQRGLGRGEDLLFQLRGALREGDAARVRFLAQSIGDSLGAAVEALASAVQRGAPHADEARRALVIMREFALPYLRNCAEVLTGDGRIHLLARIEELQTAREEAPPSSPFLLRYLRKLMLGTALVAAVAAPFFCGALAGLVLAVALSVLLAWLLIGSRSLLDRLVRWRVIRPLPPNRLPLAIAVVSLLLAPLLVADEAVAYHCTYQLEPGIFAGAAPNDVNEVSSTAYVVENLLGTQLFLDVADVYHLKVARLTATGFLGRLMTFLTRTVFDVGIISLLIAFAGVLLNRVVRRFPVSPNAELELRSEAEECGPHAALLIGAYHREIHDYLVRCFEENQTNEALYVALAASGFLHHFQRCQEAKSARADEIPEE